MSIKRKFIIFVLVVIVGVILGLLGDIDFKTTKTGYFWPGATIQSVAGIFFGITGVLAGTVFPIISSFLRGLVPIEIGLSILPDFVQSLFPYLIMKIFNFKPDEFSKKTIICFVVGCVLLPNLLGALLTGCNYIYLGDITSKVQFFTVVVRWATANIPSATIFGLILLRFFSPAIRECKIHAGFGVKEISS